MTTRQLYEQAIDRAQATEKAALLAAFDAAEHGSVTPAKPDRRRKEFKRKPAKPEATEAIPACAQEENGKP